LQYDFSKIMQSMLDNFRKRNISLIWILDYYVIHVQNKHDII
jgi:hypothetical protein